MKKDTSKWDNLERIQALQIKTEKMNTISSSFCAAKWLQTTLYLQNGYNHSCHHPTPHKIPIDEVKNNSSALHNSAYKKEQREKMIKGERPEECSYCWNIEDLGENYYSDRHTKTADYWAWDKVDDIKNSQEDVYPTYLEVSFSNACNFACAYCSPEISSKWLKDIKKNGEYPIEFGHNLDYLKSVGKLPYATDEQNPYVDAFWDWFPDAYKHLKVFRMTGGEPTMSKDFWKTLDFIKNNPRSDLEISINTNLGTPPDLIERLIQYSKELDKSCKECQIYTSCESHGKQTEYVRDGMNYDYWKSNVTKILDTTDCRVNIMTTINVLSLPSFVEFLKDMIEFRKKYDNKNYAHRTPISFNYLRFPPHLHTNILSKKVREQYSKQILDYVMQWHRDVTPDPNVKFYLEEINQVKRFCDYLIREETNKKYREQFKIFIDEYDKRRNKNFKQTFPEYENVI